MALRCEEVRDRFSALWENELTPAERTEMKGHLDLCTECREEFAKFGKTLQLVNSVEEVEVPEGFLAGIHEKIEERKRKDVSPERTFWRWPNLPPRFRLPMQALAMVVIVFMAFYLTKMMPGDQTRMKEVTESKPSLQEKKRAYGEIQTPVSEERKWDQLSLRREADKIEKGEVLGSLKEKAKTGTAERESKIVTNEPAAATSGIPARAPSNMAAASATPKREVEKSNESLAGKPEKMAGAGEVLKQPEEKASGEKSDLRAKTMAPSPVARPKDAETPQSQPFMMQKAEEASAAREASFEPKASQELVLKVTDQKVTLSRLEELMKQYGGEILNMERNRLFVSIPGTYLPEFRRELEKIGSIVKVPAEAVSKDTGGATGQGSGGRRRDAKGKNDEVDKSSVAKESRTLIQIDLIEE